MSKFEKRLRKNHQHLENALVIGTAFGHLEDLLAVFKTVFVLASVPPTIKARNLVYRETAENLEQMYDISTVFVDLKHLNGIERVMPLIKKYRSTILVEGNDPIGRNLSGELYKNHYKCVDLQGTHHVWKLEK